MGTDVAVSTPNYNLYVRVIEVHSTIKEGDKYQTPVKLEVKTIKEGRIREKIIVTQNTGEQKQMEVRLQQLTCFYN